MISWDEWLKKEWEETYFKELAAFVHEEYETKTIYPPKQQVFSAFYACPFEDIKVVILGQDPYHQPRQAHGLCFSVNPGIPFPPSLQNIFKELKEDLGCYIPNNGYLMPWAKQGVFLLNTVLTVEEGKPKSHAGKGWETFTNHAIEQIDQKEEPVVFILWGNDARSKKSLIHNPKHLILESAHPSPLSAYHGFFGSKPFSKTNNFLQSVNREPINWQIPNL